MVQLPSTTNLPATNTISPTATMTLAVTETPVTPPAPLPTQTVIVNSRPLVKTISPSVLYSGHVFLEENTERTMKPSSNMFDFDANQFSSEDIKANDIKFGLASGSSLFLVIGPMYGATGTANDRGTQNSNANFQDCLDLLPTYLKGGKPIPEKGAHYCWKTNQGRIVEFSVEDISENEGVYQIGLNYTVWDTNVN